MTDVKESKEALIGAIRVAKKVLSIAKDGLDWSDALALGTAFIADESFRVAVVEGVKGSDKIPEELKDLAASEAIELLEEIAKAWKA